MLKPQPLQTVKNKKLEVMLKNWSYPVFREILRMGAVKGEDVKYTNTFKCLYYFLRVLELRNKGLSYGRIKRVLKDKIGSAPSKSTTQID
ncbi:MAG: hypothetical protein QXK12_03815 [Candidatus Nezhaarchaeales archaeon]